MKINKNAFLVGWHAHQNTGDNAMLQVISWILYNHFHIQNINILCTQSTLPKLYLNNVTLNPTFWITDKFFLLKSFFLIRV